MQFPYVHHLAKPALSLIMRTTHHETPDPPLQQSNVRA
jgi:hypothetical protein